MLAAVLAQAYAPRGARPRWLRSLFVPFWLVQAGLQQASGTVLAVGPATVTVRQEASWRGRRVVRSVVALPTAVLALWAALVPLVGAGALTAAAGAGRQWVPAGALAGLVAGAGLLVWQLVCLVRAAPAGAQLCRVLRRLRRHGPWAEVACLAGGRDGQATRTLVFAVLAWADEQRVGLVAVPATQRLGRLYARAGFRPAFPGAVVLLREAYPASGTGPGRVWARCPVGRASAPVLTAAVTPAAAGSRSPGALRG
ncbi:hypothetical protein [Kitasatospora aureofaciens]|uniref:hypothetical protein n=1 Tax=Kitasatospora aureofaciens TaxID=1894 RepID=UPI000524D3BD|nr:hypothetical protein [Kitasatospora aureofaciens]